MATIIRKFTRKEFDTIMKGFHLCHNDPSVPEEEWKNPLAWAEDDSDPDVQRGVVVLDADENTTGETVCLASFTYGQALIYQAVGIMAGHLDEEGMPLLEAYIKMVSHRDAIQLSSFKVPTRNGYRSSHD